MENHRRDSIGKDSLKVYPRSINAFSERSPSLYSYKPVTELQPNKAKNVPKPNNQLYDKYNKRPRESGLMDLIKNDDIFSGFGMPEKTKPNIPKQTRNNTQTNVNLENKNFAKTKASFHKQISNNFPQSENSL